MATYSTTKSIGVNTTSKIKFYCSTTSTKTSTGGYTTVSAKVQIVPDGWYSVSSWTATLDGKTASGGYTKWTSTTTLVSKSIKINHNSTGVCPKKTITFTYKDTYGATSQKSWSVTVGGSSSDVIIPALTVTWPVTYTSSGTVSGMPSNQTKKYDVDLTLKTSTKPTRNGYTFLGWYSNSTKYSSGYVYKKNASLTLTAKWQKTPEAEDTTYYNIDFEAVGEVEGVPDTVIVAKGSTFIFPNNTPIKRGFIFKGWHRSGELSSTLYSPGSTYSTTIASDIIFIAQWDNDPAYLNYTITYNANGGIFYADEENEDGTPMQTETTVPQFVEGYNGDIIIHNLTPTKENYKFMGWSKTATGSVLYQPGSLCNETGNVTLYAIWQLDEAEIEYVNPIVYKRVNGAWKMCSKGYYYRINNSWIKNAPIHLISTEDGEQ